KDFLCAGHPSRGCCLGKLYRLDDPIDVLPQALDGKGLEITRALRTDSPTSFTGDNGTEINSSRNRIVHHDLVRKHSVHLDRCWLLHITGNRARKMNGVYRGGAHGLAVVRECLIRGGKRLSVRSCRLGCRSGPVSLPLLFEGCKLFRSLVPNAGHPSGLEAASMAAIARNHGLTIKVCRVDLADHFHHGARSLFGFLRVAVKRLSMAVVTTHAQRGTDEEHGVVQLALRDVLEDLHVLHGLSGRPFRYRRHSSRGLGGGRLP